ncbi:Putative germin-like protein subfamily 1 member 2 [Striga hermonthica]|uniref:Germin-like protein n=1 Tax=Striga hermonthica TaxID=68872 RepID=A0A9N7R2X0_STRHE|nr:Putative germin-like protein subfamily 1 member 2 [Striga hermonthica]
MASNTLFLTILTIILNFIFISHAFDPRPLQDFCVADTKSSVRFGSGFPCKDPALVKADDFLLRGLHLPGNTSNPLRAALTPVSVATLPGLNTLGLTLARLDLAPQGFIPPHYHPRATEAITVLEGSIEVGFVSSAPSYVHYSKNLEKGDVFIIPVGLLHYFRNAGQNNTVLLAVVNSQNAGIVPFTNGIFAAKPPIDSEYLGKAYQLDEKTIQRLQASF